MPPGTAAHSDSTRQVKEACQELDRRLRSGESCRAEELFDSYPLLKSDESLAWEVVCQEISTRQELGQVVTLDELNRRFPHWADRLGRELRHRLAEHADGVAKTVAERPAGRHVSVPAESPVSLERFEVLGDLGHGGMGLVVKARDRQLDRVVALKMIRNGALARPDEILRFHREAKALAQLRHVHVVPVYEIGQHAGQPFFTMPFLEGGSLSRRLKEFQSDPRAAVTLMHKVAVAVHAAHQKGVVHRDLKPGNILLDEQGEPFVSDFGLAKLADVDDSLTHTGQLLGTPSYMAPELLQGQAGEGAGPPATCGRWASSFMNS